MITPFPFAMAYLLDLVLGDPRRMPHPVEAIGWATNRCEGLVRRHISNLRLGGVLLWLVIVSATFTAAYLVQAAAYLIHGTVGTIVVILGAWTTLATRSLYDHGRAVVIEVEGGDLPAARRKLSMIVGRDTRGLSREEILQAVVETVAENLSDGVIAPLCYLLLGGFPLALTYKAINTLDSMVGHRTERYREIGWFAARADDTANWVPARLAGVLIVAASCVIGRSVRGSWRIMQRDGNNHLSPNSGIPEAAMAGALGIRLGGTHHYFGEPVEKPTIGDRNKVADTRDVTAALRIMLCSSVGAAVVALAMLMVVKHG